MLDVFTRLPKGIVADKGFYIPLVGMHVWYDIPDFTVLSFSIRQNVCNLWFEI